MKMQSNECNFSFWGSIENIANNLKAHRLADVFRFISFYPNEVYGPHKHQRIEINYVKKGSCHIFINNKKTTFNEGEIMIISSNANHKFITSQKGATLMQLEFLPDMFHKLNENCDIEDIINLNNSILLNPNEHPIIKIVNNIVIMRTIQLIINELKNKEPYNNYMIVLYYAELMILICRYIEHNRLFMYDNKKLQTAIYLLNQNYHSKINISDVARQTGVSDRYLRELFYKNMQITPLDYLNNIRTEKAKELLTNTEKSIKEICFVCGFSSPQYFSRVFKKQYGSTPSDYKNK